MQPITPRTVSAITGLSTAAVIGLLAPNAHADAADDHFLGMAASQDIGGPERFIGDARTACDTYGTPNYTRQLVSLTTRGLSNVQATNVLVDGIAAYCPEKLPPGPSWPPTITARESPWP